MLRRRKARQSIQVFTEYTNPAYVAAEHHKRICEALEAVERGDIPRLMIFMPPRHGKSELASRRFPAWYLGRNPNHQVIAASYNSDLADDFGREVRNIVASREYRALFPEVFLRLDSHAADRWHTNSGGVYVAAGVGTATTGRGANVLLIDDPFKDRKEADSETRRKDVWDWYTDVAYTRLMPADGTPGRIVLIQTRWHEDDLAGRLLEQQKSGGDQWHILDMPAIDDKGCALWPDWFDIERLSQIRRVLGERSWSALYQQKPTPDEGDIFKREWLRWYEEAPKHLRIYGASDYAVTEDGGDYTVHLIAGVDPSGDIYLLDLWRRQTASDVWVETFLDLVERWRPVHWAEENGQIIRSLDPIITKRQIERRIWSCVREQFASAADKVQRCQSFRARMAMGKVYLPKNADWVSDYVSELMRFNAGLHDDQVDASSLLGRLLDQMEKATVPKVEEKPKGLTFNALLKGRPREQRI